MENEWWEDCVKVWTIDPFFIASVCLAAVIVGFYVIFYGLKNQSHFFWEITSLVMMFFVLSFSFRVIFYCLEI